MSIEKKIKNRSNRRLLRVRKSLRLSCKNDKVRVSCFRSLNNFYAQAITSDNKTTVASVSSLNKKIVGDKKAVSYEIGKILAVDLKQKGIDSIVFDRGSYLYHGRVASFAQGLRDGGIKL